MTAYSLQKKLQNKFITVSSVHPGFVSFNPFINSSEWKLRFGRLFIPEVIYMKSLMFIANNIYSPCLFLVRDLGREN